MTKIDILLVEDNPGDVLLTKKAFAASSFRTLIHTVSDGEAALDYLHQRNGNENASRPDLVLLDVNLPRLSGHEVLEQVKNTPSLTAIPVIMLTGSEHPKDIERAYAQQANSYITKPASVDGMFEFVKTFENYWFNVVTLLRP